LKNPSFAGIAKSMGAEGITISHPGEVGDALKQVVASNKPTILELMVTQELGDPFRRDALKKPKRLLDKYKRRATFVGRSSTSFDGQTPSLVGKLVDGRAKHDRDGV
jgi:hypothetical protein